MIRQRLICKSGGYGEMCWLILTAKKKKRINESGYLSQWNPKNVGFCLRIVLFSGNTKTTKQLHVRCECVKMPNLEVKRCAIWAETWSWQWQRPGHRKNANVSKSASNLVSTELSWDEIFKSQYLNYTIVIKINKDKHFNWIERT